MAVRSHKTEQASEANQRFYIALQEHDFHAMATVAAISLTASVAWVTVDADVRLGDQTAAIVESNIFSFHSDRWRMVAHHASLIQTVLQP